MIHASPSQKKLASRIQAIKIGIQKVSKDKGWTKDEANCRYVTKILDLI